MLPRLIVAVLTLALPACSLLHPQFVQPTISVVGIEWRGGNLLQQTFAVKLNVQNPNDQPLPVRGLQFNLTVDGDTIAGGVSDKPFVVPALGDIDFNMNVSANLAFVVLKLAGKRPRDAASLDYDLTGAASVDLPFMHNIAFHQHGSLPLGDFSK